MEAVIRTMTGLCRPLPTFDGLGAGWYVCITRAEKKKLRMFLKSSELNVEQVNVGWNVQTRTCWHMNRILFPRRIIGPFPRT